MTRGHTIFDKIWNRHMAAERDDGASLLYIDRLLCQENSFHAFDKLRRGGYGVRCPGQVFAFADHYVPTVNRAGGIPDLEIRNMVETIESDAAQFGITLFGLSDIRQGILHVVGPEQGITLPGLIIAGADSHTSTHGAFGAFAFGVGSSDVTHILASQSLWRHRPKTMRIRIDGSLGFGVTSKDVILAIIGRIGAGGAVGHVIEYVGSTVDAMSMEARMTVCNMSIEAGARAGLIAPDEQTFAYSKGRPYAPQGDKWESAVKYWRTLQSDADAVFDQEVGLDAREIAPMVTWGTSPEDVETIDGHVPDPQGAPTAERRHKMERALAYMNLVPGTPLNDIKIDRVFIGSCTNGRIEDLRAVAAVIKGRRAVVPSLIVPGSGLIKRQAEHEGLDRVFTDAGFEWRDAGCSMCVGINGDTLKSGERCASTSNRNFEGRQGRGGRTHLMSPAMAAAAALHGRLTDVRRLEDG